MPLPASVQCLSCARFYAPQTTADAGVAVPTGTCEAYPERIPQQIWHGEHGHDRPYAGDGGLRFVQNPDREPFDVSALPDAMAYEAGGGNVGLTEVLDDRPCASCLHAHRLGNAPGAALDGTCLAFPEGIPVAILTREHDHRYAYPGDDGVRFAQDPEQPAGYQGAALTPGELRA